MRKGYTVTYQMRKKQRQQREIVIQYVLKFVGVVLLAFLLVRFVCFSLRFKVILCHQRLKEVKTSGESPDLSDQGTK